jgi:4-amino-4-deoxy-L-arabinose transferase-like glycosyltransferase
MSALERAFLSLHAVATKERLAFTLALAVAAGITLPYLGAIGFFDPWETHYAEVARRMAEDDQYLYPSWKKAHFFSKPVLLFWLTSIGYKLVGAGSADGSLSQSVELVGRLPNALFSLLCVAAVYLAARRMWSRRAAVLSAMVLATIPFWGFMSRQAITDMLYVAPMSSAILLLAIAFFDDEHKDALRERKMPLWLIAVFAVGLLPQLWEIGRSAAFLKKGKHLVTGAAGYEITNELAWRIGVGIFLCALAGAGLFFLWKKAADPLVHAAAFLVALATLGKGPHALLLTGMVYFLYLLFSGEWSLLKRRGLVTGILLYLVVALPWYIVMSIYGGRDESNKTWVGRFIMWDLLGRIGGGVHGDRGTSEYYVRYLSIGMFPWSAFFPVATIAAAMKRLSPKGERTGEERFTFLCVLWAVSFFVFFTATTTKFHHYIFPVVVPAALLIGWWLDRVLTDKRPVALGVTGIIVLATGILARDLAAEPWQLVDLFTYHYKSWKPDYYFPTSPDWNLWVGVGAGVACAILIAGVALDLVARWRGKGLGPLDAATASSSSSAFVVGALLCGLAFQIFAVHIYLARMSEHWTQRWLFETYYEMRETGEPIISYQMDWKGETFYGHNDEILIKKNAKQLKKECEKPGREFVLVQTDRLSRIKSAVGPKFDVTVVDRSNKKWFLTVVTDKP